MFTGETVEGMQVWIKTQVQKVRCQNEQSTDLAGFKNRGDTGSETTHLLSPGFPPSWTLSFHPSSSGLSSLLFTYAIERKTEGRVLHFA